tara:strand:+ start:708 stop:1262 length:555 start_codon:yes stop_codon:yes gene_type:complete
MIKELTTKKIDSTDSWDEMKMVDACKILTCGVASTPKYVDEEIGIPFLSAQNVRDGEVVLNKYKYISKEFHEKLTSKNKPTKGDLLYSRVGAKYGEAGVVEHNFEFSVYVSVTLIRAITDSHLFINSVPRCPLANSFPLFWCITVIICLFRLLDHFISFVTRFIDSSGQLKLFIKSLTPSIIII